MEMRSLESSSDGVTPNISIKSKQNLPLIGKPLSDYTPEEFLEHCQAMKDIPDRFKAGRGRKIPIARGLKIGRTKRGALSITRTKSQRPFAYVTRSEIEELASFNDVRISELWNAFKSKQFIIADNKMEAEKIYADINEIPW